VVFEFVAEGKFADTVGAGVRVSLAGSVAHHALSVPEFVARVGVADLVGWLVRNHIFVVH
jgi:hypothetical protein